MTDSKLLDSSVWLAYFTEGDCKEYIESSTILLLSAVSIFEIQKKLIQSKLPKEHIMKCMEFVKKKSIVIPVTTEIAESTISIALENHMPVIDSIIYATGILNHADVITLDNDFRGLKHAIVLTK